MDAADPDPAKLQGQRYLNCDRRYPQCPGVSSLRSVGPVFCYRHLPERRQLSGLPVSGICFASPYLFHPVVKLAVGSRMEIMTAIFSACGGIIATVMFGMGSSTSTAATLPAEIVTAIERLGLLESISLWLVSLLGSLLITVMSFILLLTVYGRFFRLYCIHCLGSATSGYLRRGGHRRQRLGISKKLHLRVHGRDCHRPALPDLLRFFVKEHPSSGLYLVCRNYGVAVHWTADFQYTDSHQACQESIPYREGDVGARA